VSEKINMTLWGDMGDQTLTRTRSVDIPPAPASGRVTTWRVGPDRDIGVEVVSGVAVTSVGPVDAAPIAVASEFVCHCYCPRRKPLVNRKNARRTRLQFVPVFPCDARLGIYHPVGKNLVPERQRVYQVCFLGPSGFYVHRVCSLLQQSHRPVYYRPPRSGLYMSM
jgi:hypothetical protein